MHILFISDGYNRYGAPRSMKQLIENLLRYCPDLEISVVLLYRSDTEEYYRRLGCKTYKVFYGPYYQGIPGKRWKLPIKVILTGIEYLIGRAAGAYWLSKKLDMTSVDIIHANSSREDLGAILALKYKKPFVWHIREFGLGCFSFRKDICDKRPYCFANFLNRFTYSPGPSPTISRLIFSLCLSSNIPNACMI